MKPVRSTDVRNGQNTQVVTVQRKTLDNLFDEQIPSKSTNSEQKRRNAYVSELINVQSLMNIRALAACQRKRNDSKSFEDRIIINVCGERFETHRTTLELYPHTLLGNRKYRKHYFDKTRNEYFFDRNRACFEAILYYYQSNGRLRRPNFVPIDIFLEEVTFFKLGQEALKQLREDENIKEVKKVRLPKSHWRRCLWATMEYPDYSMLAKIVNIISSIIVLVSTITLAIESLPEFSTTVQINCKKYYTSIINNSNLTEQEPLNQTFVCREYFSSEFFIIQSICVALFTIELFLRLISTPSLFDFIKTFMNWIDIISIMTYYILLTIHLVDVKTNINASTYTALRLIRTFRFIRILKFYRMFKSIKSLRVLSSTLKQSMPDFIIMIIILTVLSFLFGAATYFAENEVNNAAFDSILKATYWGIMTITSVGYGDIYPITPIGRIISCLCALTGAAMIGMLVSVLVDRYQRVFARKLYIEEEIIDFDDYSDEECTDTDSRTIASSNLCRRNHVKEIEDPDARARANAAFESNENESTNTTNIEVHLEPPLTIENPISRQSSRVHFIIGYVEDETHETSKDLLNTISTVVAQKQTSGENIQLNIISNDQQEHQEGLPGYVKFRISESTDDDTDDELTEITSGPGHKGNVLKKFQSSPICPTMNKHQHKYEKHV